MYSGVFSICCSFSLIYMALFYILLLNFAFLFFSPFLFMCFVLLALFLTWHLGFISCSVLCFSFVFNWLISRLVSFVLLVTLCTFVFFGLSFFFVSMYISVCVMFLSFCFCLSDFAFTICLGFVFCFFYWVYCSFVLIPFIDITNGSCGLGTLTRSRAWPSGGGVPSSGS